MPLFDFKCRDCGNEFETLVMGSDKAVCPTCGSADLEKQMSTFSARTGSGDKTTSDSGGGSKCGGCSGRNCSTCR